LLCQRRFDFFAAADQAKLCGCISDAQKEPALWALVSSAPESADIRKAAGVCNWQAKCTKPGPAGTARRLLRCRRCTNAFFFRWLGCLFAADEMGIMRCTCDAQKDPVIWAAVGKTVLSAPGAPTNSELAAACAKVANGGLTVSPSFLFAATAAGLAVFGARARFA
jgi:hypothetical protein